MKCARLWKEKVGVEVWGENPEFNFGHVKFEMLLRYWCGNVKKALG